MDVPREDVTVQYEEDIGIEGGEGTGALGSIKPHDDIFDVGPSSVTDTSGAGEVIETHNTNGEDADFFGTLMASVEDEVEPGWEENEEVEPDWESEYEDEEEEDPFADEEDEVEPDCKENIFDSNFEESSPTEEPVNEDKVIHDPFGHPVGNLFGGIGWDNPVNGFDSADTYKNCGFVHCTFNFNGAVSDSVISTLMEKSKPQGYVDTSHGGTIEGTMFSNCTFNFNDKII